MATMTMEAIVLYSCWRGDRSSNSRFVNRHVDRLPAHLEVGTGTKRHQQVHLRAQIHKITRLRAAVFFDEAVENQFTTKVRLKMMDAFGDQG